MMSFLTPPPDLDESGDATNMLPTNNCIPDIFYPSPTSSCSGRHPGTYSPHSPVHRQQERLYMDQDAQPPPMFSDPAASGVYETVPTAHGGNMYQLEVPFNMYDQSPWTPYPSMTPQYPPIPSAHEDASSFFPQYSNSDSAVAAQIIPSSPRPALQSPYAFGGSMGMPDSTSYLNSLHQHQPFTPDTSTSTTMSISSRSCSPNPSHVGSTPSAHRRQSRSSVSIAHASSPLSHYGIPVRAPGSSSVAAPQAWRCAYPGCTSRATFIRGCDLRKHYNRHSKHLFCRVDGCQQSEAVALQAAQAADPHCTDPSQLVLSGGFSSKKDRARHEAKHNPGIKCEWHGADGEECGRVFSRMDNMKDHVRRIHQKGQTANSSTSSSSSAQSRKTKRVR